MPGYDPFVRGSFPVGVRTIQPLDKARNRSFPCEIWYPAAAQHQGQDLAPETQDVFTAPRGDTPRRQTAVRNAMAHRDLEAELAYAAAHAINDRIVLTRVARVGDQAVDVPELYFERLLYDGPFAHLELTHKIALEVCFGGCALRWPVESGL